MNTIRAICFDLDNTLWDVWPVIRRAEQAMYDFLALHYPQAVASISIEGMRDSRARVALDYPHMAHDFSFLRRQALREQANACGCPETMAEEAFDVFLQARNQVELYAEVRPALQLLGARYRLFTASNGNADLGRIGIGHFFERTVAAREVGVLKPDAAIFHKVIEGTGLAPAEVLFVGDDPELDVEGARRVGMQPVWMDRDGVAWPPGLAPPPHTIRSLNELIDLLGCGSPPPLARSLAGH